MKKVALLAIVALSTALFAFKTNDASTWTVDAVHSKLSFTITHLMVNDVEGEFKDFTATVITPGADFEGATVNFTAKAASISTDNDQRDAHVKSADFLDAATFPTITFTSTSFKKVSGNTYVVTGSLTLHGVTKTVSLGVLARTGTNPMSHKTIAGIKITGTIKRSDFGIGTKFPEAMLSDEIAINANTEFAKN